MRGQVVVVTALILAVMLLSVIASVYGARLVYLRTRSIVVREVVGSITADFERALAHVLAVATRAYFNYSRYERMLAKYRPQGINLYNRHNFTVARDFAFKFLETWRVFVVETYAGYGVQVGFEPAEWDVSGLLGRRRAVPEGALVKGWWYYPSSASAACARLRLNLTNAGFYGWVSTVRVGVSVRIWNFSVGDDYTELTIGVAQDGEPWPYLLTKGRVEVYYPSGGGWRRAEVDDVTYLGNGNYTVRFRPALETLYDPVEGREFVPAMVVVEDDRGIVVEACTYTHITFRLERRVPDSVPYGHGGIRRPRDTRHEVYTLEFTWDLDIYWLGMKLPEEEGLRLPPVPWLPIKQLRVNVTADGTLETLRERPIQYEEWRNVTWHGVEVPVPLGLSDPQMDFSPTTRLVFQVGFPTLDVDEQYVAIWWLDDLDAEPAAYPSSIRYIEDSTHKDVWHPLYDVEFVDVEHPESRGYVDYEGVAAFVLRDPETDFAFGPYNLHAFDRYGNKLGRYRPYGTWDVYWRYMRYSWIQAPIRIFAVLNTTLVGNVYREGDVRGDYYDTIAVAHIINGTRYIPVITCVYWKRSRLGYGYWLCTEMGRGVADWFAYINLDYDTGDTPFEWGHDDDCLDWEFDMSCWNGVNHEPEPGFMLAHWTSGVGRAVVLSQGGLETLYDVGREEAFAVTMYAPHGLRQGSVEYVMWPYYRREQVEGGTLLRFWAVVFDFRGSGDGWLSTGVEDMWRNAYVYALMFLEDYAPLVRSP